MKIRLIWKMSALKPTSTENRGILVRQDCIDTDKDLDLIMEEGFIQYDVIQRHAQQPIKEEKPTLTDAQRVYKSEQGAAKIQRPSHDGLHKPPPRQVMMSYDKWLSLYHPLGGSPEHYKIW